MWRKAVACGLLALIAATGVPLVPVPSPPLRGVRLASSHISLVVGQRRGVGCAVTQGVSVPAGAAGGVSFPIAYNPFSCVTLVRVGILSGNGNQSAQADQDCYVLRLESGKVAVPPPGYKCIKVVLPNGKTYIRSLTGANNK